MTVDGMLANGKPARLWWAAGTTITADGETGVRLSCPAVGRAWRMDAGKLGQIVRWVAAPDGPPPGAVARLAEAGLLVDARTPADGEIWGPARRFHGWAGHDIYQDGADPSGIARQAVLSRFSPEDLALIRHPDADAESEPVLSPGMAEVVWQASARMRANRVRVATATSASALLYSYGTAHSLIVIDPAACRTPVAWADLGRMGHGRPIAADPSALLRAARLDEQAPAVAVVGSFPDYQRRYRHEKAMRGFLVDGGRILGEVARAVATKYGSAAVSDGPLPEIAPLAGLDETRILVVGLAGMPSADQQATDPLRAAAGGAEPDHCHENELLRLVEM